MASCGLQKQNCTVNRDTIARHVPTFPASTGTGAPPKVGSVMSKSKRYQVRIDDLQKKATVSVEQAAYLIGISRQAAYNAVERGEIEAIKYGRRVLVLAKPLYQQLIGSTSGGSLSANEMNDGSAEGLMRSSSDASCISLDSSMGHA